MYEGAGHDLFIGRSGERFMDDLRRFIAGADRAAGAHHLGDGG